ncbi:MAG: hypothetical protein IJG13_12660, partial [Kiritimatiellae bacterium]|nr:hypothetical protein [Kiritimatiellia bacterium]
IDMVVVPSLTATAASQAAGIGGSSNESHGVIYVFGGVIAATGGENAAGIGSGCFADDSAGASTLRQGSVNISGGEVTATGGANGAGIGGGSLHSGGLVEISYGKVMATGGDNGAGIGGGYGAWGHTIRIHGGEVTAEGTVSGAGIGGGSASGDHGSSAANTEPCQIAVSGGRVTARGGQGASGIGSGLSGTHCAAVNVTGGTVVAAAGSQTYGYTVPDDIGFGCCQTTDARSPSMLTIKGASVHAIHRAAGSERVSPAPSNGDERVWCVTVETSKTNELVRIEHLAGFDEEESEIYADADGKVYVWLPNGTHVFYAGDRPLTATVNNADATAGEWLSGVMIDGVDASCREVSGQLWYYDLGERTLYIAGDYVVSGTNTSGYVNILAGAYTEEGGGEGVVSLSISNLCLKSTFASPFAATNGTVTVRLVGENLLDAADSDRYAGLSVVKGASLVVTNLGTSASLTAKGGRYAAGIGGNRSAAIGSIAISGGIITATGGRDGGAGIGGGHSAKYSDGAKIAISGGTISARGGWYESGYHAADIGLGMEPDSGEENYRVVFSGSSTWMVNGCFDETGHDSSITPVNEAGARVYKATITGFTPHAKVEIEMSNYGTNDIYADSVGSIYLWLANGTYYVDANGRRYALRMVNGTATTIALPDAYGVKVDGVDVVKLSGNAWSYNPFSDTLALTADCTLSGTNTYKSIEVYVYNDVTVAVDRLSLSAADEGADLLTGGTLTITNGTSVLLGLVSCDLVIRGGSHVIYSSTIPSVSNGSDYVEPVILRGYAPNAPVEIEGPTDYYGTSNIFADGNGKVYLWLPEGTFNIKINGVRYILDVDFIGNGTLLRTVGVEVNGTDAANGSGAGWSYDRSTGTIAITGDCTLSGTNTAGEAKIVADADVTISPSRLVIEVGAGEEALSGPGTVTITNGTAHMTGDVSCPVKLLGGSFRLDGAAAVAFSNETEAVYCVEVPGLTPNTAVAFDNLPPYYGKSGIFADAAGKVYLWLPENWEEPHVLLSASPKKGLLGAASGKAHTFSANGYSYTVTINSASGGAVAEQGGPLPLESLKIENFAVEDGWIVIDVKASPATWINGFADHLRIRASETLPIPETDDTLLDMSGAELLIQDGESATIAVPLPDGSRGRFFKVVE